jgi:hypothetical protein
LIRTRLLSLVVVALLGAGLATGCGGDDEGGDEDPQQVLDETFSNDQAINSGVFDLSLGISAEGDEGGSFDASLGGPFQGDENATGEFPQFDLTASLTGEGGGESIDFEGGLIATSDKAFVSYQDNTYEVPQEFFDQIKQLSEQAAAKSQEQQSQDSSAVFERLGIDPSGWVTEPTNEGNEDVEGTDTIHIHADADIPAIVEDFQSAVEQSGAGTAPQLPPDALQQLEDAVDEASIDVYTGAEDKILRRLTLNLGITPPEGDSSVTSADVEFSLTFSEVNEDQTIEAPIDARSFSDLETEIGLPPGTLESALSGGLGGGLGGLGGGSLGGGSLGGGGGSVPQLPGGGGGGGGGSADALTKCLQNATSEQQINDCLTQ